MTFKVGDKVRVKKTEKEFENRFGQVLVIDKIIKDLLWFNTNTPNDFFLFAYRVEKISSIKNKLK
jgi:hypothetical protein